MYFSIFIFKSKCIFELHLGLYACMTIYFFVFDFKPTVRTISVKVHMHCDKCEADLKQRLIKHKGNSIKDILFDLYNIN